MGKHWMRARYDELYAGDIEAVLSALQVHAPKDDEARRAGMHGTAAGADAIIALRFCKLSGRFEDFWEPRAEAHAA